MSCTSGTAASSRMSNFTLSLVLGLVAALADVFGALILVRTHWEKRYLRYFVALGAGFMLSAALLEMIPESFRLGFSWTPLLVLGGYCLIHLLEHSIDRGTHDELLSTHTSNTVVAGLAAHSLFDGVAIASGFVLSSWLGWIIFVAILLHKLPEGFTVASVMLASGHSRTAALSSAIVVAAATLAGVLVINFFPAWVRAGLPIAAGVALYVTATDLVPEVNREPGIRMALVFFGGVVAFLLCKFLADGLLR
jgi:zinc transporter ZupT